MIKTLEKYPILTLALLVSVMLLPNINSLQVSIMEARNFITAREMLSDGNWFLTSMNGEARYEKPPLPTWITAFFGLLFGIKNIFALRLPAVIMVWVVGVFTYFISRNLLTNKLHSLVNGIIVVTSFYVFGIIIEAPWDIYTHGFMLIAIFYLIKTYTETSFINVLIASFFVGCSVLSKGPISMYGLLLPFIVAYGIVFKLNRKNLFKTLFVIVLGVLIGGGWFVYVRVADAESFLKIASRETSNWSNYSVKPFYHYWSFFTQSGLWTIPAFISLLYPYLKNKVSNIRGYKLSFYWTIIAVILLSVIPEKKPRYLVPVLIPLAINTGFYIEYLFRNFKTLRSKKEVIPVYFNFGLLGIIGILFPILGFILLKEKLNTVLSLYILASFLLVSTGGLIFFQLYKKEFKNVFYLSIFLLVAIMITVIPIGNVFVIQNKNYTEISLLKDEPSNQQIQVYVLDAITPEMLWDYGSKIPMIKEIDSVYKFPDVAKFGVLVNDENNLNLELWHESFTINKIAVYDLNTSALNSRSYRQRLISHYFIFEKK